MIDTDQPSTDSLTYKDASERRLKVVNVMLDILDDSEPMDVREFHERVITELPDLEYESFARTLDSIVDIQGSPVRLSGTLISFNPPK